jgi:uncharacterized protein (TIGR00251 family)
VAGEHRVRPDTRRLARGITSSKPPNKMEIAATNGSVSFHVQVQPRASRDAIEGEYADALKIRLTVPLVDARANESLVCLLAERLNVPLAAVRIVAGKKSRRKRVVVAGVRREQVLALLSAAKRAAR